MTDRHEQLDGGRLSIGDVLRRSTAFLTERGCEAPRLDAERLVGRVLGMERIELYMHLDRPLTEPEVVAARELVARRGRREPLQYVLGEWGFRRLTLAVDRRALIPRPETEIVVERCLALLEGAEAPRVLDVGTGSGAIALAIADEHRGAAVTAIDASVEALALARENADRTSLAIELARHDLFDGLPPGPWDLVVANPPYVGAEEMGGLAPEVVEWEPHSALVEDGHTEALVRSAARVLRPRGALVLEIHDERSAGAASLLDSHGFGEVAVTPDLSGRDRVVEGRVGVDGRPA